MGFGGVVFFLGVWVMTQPVGFASAAYDFDAIACIIGNGTIIEADVSPDMLKWAQDGVDAHNKYRKKHGTPPLVLNPKMCKSAQWSANWNAPDTNWENRNPHTQNIAWIGFKGMKCGENMAARHAQKSIRAEDTVKAWYSEIELYDFAKHAAKPEKVVGHFLNVVWKATKEMCMAYGRAKTGEYFIAAHYFPPGGFPAEAHAENVLNPNSANNYHFKTGIILIWILCVHFL